MKLQLKITVVLLVLLMLVSSGSALATNLKYIESFIEGKQDYIVFGSIEEVNGSGDCTLYITEVVGESDEVKNADEQPPQDNPSDVINSAGSQSAAEMQIRDSVARGSTIEVSNFNSYLYYDEDMRSPRKGDNVLLSLKFGGNVYMIENGAFLVTAADYDSFMIKVPESVDTDTLAEVTAIYNYVKSNGRNSDLTIRDGNVYTHEAGNEKALEVPTGVNITDDFGDSVDSQVLDKKEDTKSEQDKSVSFPGEKWIYALVILVVGSLVGVVITHVSLKLEKRADKQ